MELVNPKQQQMNQSKDEISFIDLSATLWQKRKLIILVTVLAAVLSVTFALVSKILPPEKSPLPNKYKSTAVVILSDETSSGSLQSYLSGSGLSSLAGLAGVSTGSSSGDVAVMLLSGKTIIDQIVKEFDLINRYKIKKDIVDTSRKLTKGQASFTFDKDTNTVSVVYEDIDPEFARDVANRFVQLLMDRFASISNNKNVRQKQLLEDKMNDVQSRILRLEDEIKNFQREYGTIDPQAYATEQAKIISEMKVNLLNKEIELETMQEFTRKDHPEVMKLEAERDQLQKTITELEKRYFNPPNSNFSTQEDIPDLAVKFSRMERDLQLQTGIYTVLSQQYEVTKLSMNGDEAQMQILELADTPQIKSGPRRSILVMGITLGAFIVACIWALTKNSLMKLKADPEIREKFRAGKKTSL